MNLARIVGTFTLALLGAVPARADDLGSSKRWSIDASTGAAYVTNRAFDTVGGSDALPVGDFRASYTPGWLSDHLELNAAFVIAGEGGSTLSTWQTSFGMDSFQLGASYRWRPSRWISFYGRGAVVLDVDRLSLSATNDALPLSQTALTVGGLLGLGTELTFFHEPLVDVGLTVEVGYALRFNDARFNQMKPDVGGSSPTPIAFEPVNAGQYDVSGMQWRLGLAVHF
jgi:hypothetical protein